MSAQERYQILVEMNANVSKAVTALEKVSGKMGETEKKTAGLQGVLKNAAGFLVRDFARSMGGAITDAVELGGNIDTLRRSFEALSVASGQQVPTLDDLRTATQGMVSDSQLLQAANQALQLGLPTENLDDMMMSAIQLGSAMGIDATQAVTSLSTGIGRQSKLILDNLGIVFDATDAYEWYAEQIGVSSDELDENAKKEAWMQYAIEQVNKKAKSLGDNISEQTKKQAQWNASIHNFKTRVGEALQPVAGLITTMQPLLPLLSTMAIQYLPDLIGKVPKFAESIGKLDISAKSLALSVGAGVAAFGSVYGILISLPPELRTTASTVAIVTGALIAATAAAVAFWTSISVGTLAPVIIAGVATSIAGVMVALQDAGDVAEEVTKDLDAVADSALGVGDVMDDTADKVIDSWTKRLSVEENEWTKLIGSYDTYYDQLVSIAQDSYATQIEDANSAYDTQLNALGIALDQKLSLYDINFVDLRTESERYYDDAISLVTDHFDALIDETDKSLQARTRLVEDNYKDETRLVQDEYSQRLQDTRDFYDTQIGIINAGLAAIRGERSDELDALELAYLLDKTALESSFDAEIDSADDFAEQMKALTDNYRSAREDIGESYRIQELQYEQDHKDELETLEQDKTDALITIETDKTDALTTLESKKNAEIEALEAEHKTALETINNEKSAALQTVDETLKDKLIEIEDTKNTAILVAENTLVDNLKEINNRRVKDVTNMYRDISILDKAYVASQASLAPEAATAWNEYLYSISKEGAMKALMTKAHEAFEAENFTKYLNILKLLEMREWATPEELESARAAVPVAASGGIFGLSGPELIQVGERGPEAVVPLSRMGGGEVNINFYAPMVTVEGNADRETALVAAELVKASLKTIKIKASSPEAVTSQVVFPKSASAGLATAGSQVHDLLNRTPSKGKSWVF